MSSGYHDGTRREFITELQLQSNDVLLGRGAPISGNTGNVRFLALVRERCSDYKQAPTRKEKDAIAREIVSTIHVRNGLFLRRIDSPEEELQFGVPPGVTAWTAADEKTVLLKIKQALRDRAALVEEQDHHQGQQIENAGTAAQVPSNLDDQVLGRDGHASAASMSDPAKVSDAVVHRFQGVPDNMLQQFQQFPLNARFPTVRIQTGTFLSQAPTPQLALQGQDSTMRQASFAALSPAALANFEIAGENPTTAAGATMNLAATLLGATGLSQPSFAQPLPRRPHAGQHWDTNAAAGLNLQPDSTNASLQRLEGKRRKVDFGTAAFPHDALVGLQMNKGGELIDDQKPVAKSNMYNDTSGEAALVKACQVCEMMGQTMTFTNVNGNIVKLDYIELCLLSILISRGLPTWSSTKFRNGDIVYTSNPTPCPFTWTNVGHHLVEEVQMCLYSKKLMPLNNNTANQQQRSAIAGFVSRLVALSSAYSKNPTSLARMTIMLLEKLRLYGGGGSRSQLTSNAAPAAVLPSSTSASMRFPGLDTFGRSASMMSDSEDSNLAPQRALLVAMGGGDGAAATTTDQSGSSHGAPQQLRNDDSFSKFLSKELGQWAASLNVADDIGFPVPGSSSDLAASYPQFGQNDVFSTAGILDASGCQAVLSQVSLLTRLRLMFQNNSSDQMISILQNPPAAPTAVVAAPPPQWGASSEETALIDMSLLQALLAHGFSGLMDLMTNSDDLLGILLRHASITKVDVEKRAFQLTGLLHDHIQSMRLNQITNEQSARIGEIMGL